MVRVGQLDIVTDGTSDADGSGIATGGDDDVALTIDGGGGDMAGEADGKICGGRGGDPSERSGASGAPLS